MVDDAQRSFLAANRRAALVTIKRDGRPQTSNVLYGFDGTTVRISLTADRAKTRNATRDPRVAVHVIAENFGQWLAAEGDAELTPVAAATDDATVDALVELYRSLAGEHPDWAEFREVQVQERRQVLSFVVTHAYGQVPR